MAKGLAIPLGVNTYGGTATVEGDEQASKIIKLALGAGENENAFQQDVAMGELMIFGLNNTQLRADITKRLYRLTAQWEEDKLYKLVKNSIKWTVDQANSELTLECEFINLESDTPIPFSQAFSTGA
jgi:hypothetical protein